MENVIACNLGSYRQYRNEAYEHLAEIGLTNVEIPCPEPEDVKKVQADLDRYGLRATSLIVRCQMDVDDTVQRFSHSLDTVAKMGVSLVFTSVKTGGVDRDYVYGKLQDIGDAAMRHGIVVALETHPDLVTNADVALATMQGVAHSNIRVNFDTANVHYYNENVDAVEQFAQIVDYVAAVHLKDTNGKFQTWHFPALGEGVVDFPEIFRMFSARGHSGPYTMELEGIKGEELTKEQVQERVEKSLGYLREQGLVG
ncbi:MAG: sugar phosphate isomerase/epimerase [bacterium]|nr:sugar phosphate isomerase/epimerase [bacterium]